MITRVLIQATDQNLELEVLRAQKDTNSENLQSERENLINELESVNNSFQTLSDANVGLKNLINAKKMLVETTEAEISQKSQAIDGLSQKVSTP